MKFYLYLSVSSFLLFLPALFLQNGEWMGEALIAAVLSAANSGTAWFLAVRSAGQAYGSFVKSVFGGMALRIMLMIIATIAIIKSAIVATIPFFLYLVIYYITHQIIEIWMLNRILPTLNKNKESGKQ